MENETLYNWKAKRAGGRITITGENVNDEKIKIVGVDKIEAGAFGSSPTATDKNGKKYQLA